MDFNGIIGQRDIVSSLTRALTEDRVGHAYIFTGPAGMGKRTFARIFAGLLLCASPDGGASCGHCRGCQLYGNGSNPDFHWITIAPDETLIGVDRIRDIQMDAVIKPMYSKRKIYVVEDADRMTEQAQNCLLKTFEEPPANVVVILLTSNYEAMLETIRSRAQKVSFRNYTEGQVLQALSGRFKDRKLLELAAGYSDGNIGRAVELLDSKEFGDLREKLLTLLTGVGKGMPGDILAFGVFLEDNRDNAELLLDMMQMYYRDLLVACETGDEKLLINTDKKDMILGNARGYRSQSLLDNIAAVGDVRRALRQNANYQLAADSLGIRLRGDRP